MFMIWHNKDETQVVSQETWIYGTNLAVGSMDL